MTLALADVVDPLEHDHVPGAGWPPTSRWKRATALAQVWDLNGPAPLVT